MAVRRYTAAALLAVYTMAVLLITVVPTTRPSRWPGEPWYTTVHLVPGVVPPVGFGLNIVMFVPLGILVPLVWPRTASYRRIFWIALAASSGIELTQLLLWVTAGIRRTTDVNDLLSNVPGALLGWWLLRRHRRARSG